MASAALQRGSLENAPTPKEESENQEAPGPVSTLWTDWEISLFLYEWEVVEREVQHPGKIDEKSEVIAQRLLQRGVRKDPEQCLYLLESMQDLYWILCNERPRSEPLFSPYREALYRILGYPNARRCFPDSADPSGQSTPVPSSLWTRTQLRLNMASAALQCGSLENVPVPKEENENQEAQGAAGPVSTLWTDWEISLFLYEWEVVEREVRHPGKIDEKSEVIAQRLLQRGVRKDPEQCLYLLESMQDLYWILCNERPRSEPLFSPYREALYRILGYPIARGCFPDPAHPSGQSAPAPAPAPAPVLSSLWTRTQLTLSMSSAVSQNGSLENVPVPKVENENQEAQGAAGPVSTLWIDWEISLFLYEWEVVEREVRHPGKSDEKSEVIAQRLLQRGVRKDPEQCLYLLESMQDLYWILCNERPRSEPLFSPYRDALYRILGYPNARGCFPGPPQFQQFPGYIPPPVYAMAQVPQAPQWQPWHMRPPWEVPYMIPVVVPRAPIMQQPSSASNQDPDPH